MAYNVKPKLFLQDLSNYSEIRRGLSPAMRKATPSLKELKSVDAGMQQQIINELNEWRQSSQSQKISAAQSAKGVISALGAAAQSDYYTSPQKAQIKLAGLKLRNMDPDAAAWEVRESLSTTGRLHNQDFYKAKYYLDDDVWDPSAATDSMLYEIIYTGGILQYDEKTIMDTIKEYLKRKPGTTSKNLNAKANTELTNVSASFYNDILNIAKSING